jgi:hypothetical protein
MALAHHLVDKDLNPKRFRLCRRRGLILGDLLVLIRIVTR